MKGIITGKEVFLHSPTIVRHWGLAAFLACAWAAVARRRSTFLSVLYASSPVGGDPAVRGAPVTVPRWRASR
jgi:hypothetical protein